MVKYPGYMLGISRTLSCTSSSYAIQFPKDTHKQKTMALPREKSLPGINECAAHPWNCLEKTRLNPAPNIYPQGAQYVPLVPQMIQQSVAVQKDSPLLGKPQSVPQAPQTLQHQSALIQAPSLSLNTAECTARPWECLSKKVSTVARPPQVLSAYAPTAPVTSVSQRAPHARQTSAAIADAPILKGALVRAPTCHVPSFLGKKVSIYTTREQS